MIEFTDMSVNALDLSRCANRIHPADSWYDLSNHIKELITSTCDAYTDIYIMNKIKSEFVHSIHSVVNDRVIPDLDDYEIDEENVYSYMVCLIRLANFINLVVCDGSKEKVDEYAKEVARIQMAWEIAGSQIKNKICFDSKIAKIYYVINNYDAVLQYEYYNYAEDRVVFDDYIRMLGNICDIISSSNESSVIPNSEIERVLVLEINGFYCKSHKRIDALNSITISIREMVINIRDESLNKTGAINVTEVIRKHVSIAVSEIYDIITNSKMHACSYFKYYISKYINPDDSEFDYSNRTRRDEFISNIACIAEGYTNLSEFDKACLNAILSFKTYTEVCDSNGDDDYSAAISELNKLLTATSIKDVIKINGKINNLIPVDFTKQAISIGIDSHDSKDNNSESDKASFSDIASSIDKREWKPELKELANTLQEAARCMDALLGDDDTDNDQKNNKPANSEPISWNEYFMELAETAAKRSKDPKSKVGACIMDPKDHRVVSLGYNGFPYGCSDDEFPWSKEGDDNKYLYVVHAELNAILSARRDLTGCVIFVTYSPCNECMKAIIQSGIKMVIYKNEYKPNGITNIASSKMADAAGVILIKYDKLIKACDELIESEK